jgi:phosphatidylinositol glycan class V
MLILVRDVGLFRYWKISNLPLFLLAAPMYLVLTLSATWALNYRKKTVPESREKPTSMANPHTAALLQSLAVPQLLLIILNLTTAHVQIISRISSAYPVWLWYGASHFKQGNSKNADYLVRFAILYAVIQAGLFASFLPPA